MTKSEIARLSKLPSGISRRGFGSMDRARALQLQTKGGLRVYRKYGQSHMKRIGALGGHKTNGT